MLGLALEAVATAIFNVWLLDFHARTIGEVAF